jgi:hypothetical protein
VFSRCTLNLCIFVRFEVLIELKMSVLVFWAVMLCWLVDKILTFGEMYCLHLHNLTLKMALLFLWNIGNLPAGPQGVYNPVDQHWYAYSVFMFWYTLCVCVCACMWQGGGSQSQEDWLFMCSFPECMLFTEEFWRECYSGLDLLPILFSYYSTWFLLGCVTARIGPIYAGIPHWNLFLFLNFILALINICCIHLSFSFFLMVYHCFTFKKYTGTFKFPFWVLGCVLNGTLYTFIGMDTEWLQ